MSAAAERLGSLIIDADHRVLLCVRVALDTSVGDS